MKDFNLREYLKNNPLLKEEEDIDYDVIVDDLENHVETFKQIAGMGEESRPYFWKGLFKGKLPTHIIK